jgi:hypothetical protein
VGIRVVLTQLAEKVKCTPAGSAVEKLADRCYNNAND